MLEDPKEIYVDNQHPSRSTIFEGFYLVIVAAKEIDALCTQLKQECIKETNT